MQVLPVAAGTSALASEGNIGGQMLRENSAPEER
jgi:hypothetical protein